MNTHNVGWSKTDVAMSTSRQLKKTVLEQTIKIKIQKFKNLIWQLSHHVG